MIEQDSRLLVAARGSHRTIGVPRKVKLRYQKWAEEEKLETERVRKQDASHSKEAHWVLAVEGAGNAAYLREKPPVNGRRPGVDAELTTGLRW